MSTKCFDCSATCSSVEGRRGTGEAAEHVSGDHRLLGIASLLVYCEADHHPVLKTLIIISLVSNKIAQITPVVDRIYPLSRACLQCANRGTRRNLLYRPYRPYRNKCIKALTVQQAIQASIPTAFHLPTPRYVRCRFRSGNQSSSVSERARAVSKS